MMRRSSLLVKPQPILPLQTTSVRTLTSCSGGVKTDLFYTCLAFRVMLVQPSSACVERAFSQLRNLLTDRQEQTLENSVELSVMLAFNEASRNSLPNEVYVVHK